MDLAQRLADDLDAAFPLLVDRYGAAVYSLVLRLCGRTEAEDLAQDAFVRAYTALRKYDQAKVETLAVRPWVLTIALNVARNRLRTLARHPATPLGDAEIPTDSDTDARIVLAEALLRLPLAPREAIVLRHVVGCTTDEVATVLDRPSGTVKAQVARGLATLRAYLKEDV